MNGGNSQSVLSNNVASSPPAVLSNSISANLTVNSSNMTPSPATNTSAILVTDYRQVITNQSGSQQVVQQSLPSYLPVDSMPVQSQQTQQMQVQQSQSQPNVNHVNMVQQNQSQMQVQTMSPQQLAASQAQAGYYMPPAIYVDQNGQPVYYRVGECGIYCVRLTMICIVHAYCVSVKYS